MRYFGLLVLLTIFLNGAQSIDTKINNYNKKLQAFKKDYNKVNNKLSQNAKQILVGERNLLKLRKNIQELSNLIKAQEKKYHANMDQLNNFTSSQQKLQVSQKEIQSKLVFLFAKHLSLSLVIDDENVKNSDNLITEEAFKVLRDIAYEDIKSLQKNFNEQSKQIQELQDKIDMIKTGIDLFNQKKKRLQKEEKNERLMLKQLKRKKSEYKISINQLLKRRNSVRDTLKELNIVKLRQKEEAERRKKEEKQRKKIEERDMDDEKELPDVKSYASTYHAVKTIRYRGKKTIAPLRKYVVTKQYGPYVDPVYNIKIFNESITMEAKGSDKRVRNVFNGKVVLAKATPMLDNIVIVEHKNGLHTIYAHLSEIAPHIRKGKKVKKGAIIGKIAKELLFEVTQKNAHINPVTLIN